MPEADIPMELIREQLEEEDGHLSQAEDFDPYVGNTLVSSLRQDTSSSGTGFIAFPMGDIMSDLSAYRSSKQAPDVEYASRYIYNEHLEAEWRYYQASRELQAGLRYPDPATRRWVPGP